MCVSRVLETELIENKTKKITTESERKRKRKKNNNKKHTTRIGLNQNDFVRLTFPCLSIHFDHSKSILIKNDFFVLVWMMCANYMFGHFISIVHTHTVSFFSYVLVPVLCFIFCSFTLTVLAIYVIYRAMQNCIHRVWIKNTLNEGTIFPWFDWKLFPIWMLNLEDLLEPFRKYSRT